MFGVCIFGWLVPGMSPNALISGLKSSTAKKRTFFAPDGAGTGFGVGGRGGGGACGGLPDVPF